MATPLLGTSFIGFSRSSGEEPWLHAVQPGTGDKLEPAFLTATSSEVDHALALAARAFPVYSALPRSARAGFLRAIAVEIEAVTEDIVGRGQLETALSADRLRSETGRVLGHLRMFADLVAEGSWVDARIDRADPDRKPSPKPDIRSMLRPLGPVAVFCAGNFPLAYSVAGGDSVSALAAGCPVVVIVHEGHPGVAEIVAAAVIRAAHQTWMPEGVFSVLNGGGRSIGQTVVKHPAIRAVGFTGSRAGGLALMEIAAKREQPIPVYAEMSSVNPIVILPGALARGEEVLAEAFHASLTLGVGQFCTNPGLVFLPTGKGDGFIARLKELIGASPAGIMLNAGICRSFEKSTAAMAATPGVEALAASGHPPGPDQAAPMVFTTAIGDFVKDRSMQREMFGPATLIVRGTSREIEQAIPLLDGQLTASLHATGAELLENTDLVFALRERCGRFIFNGFPTGVEVGNSTVHGGPYPSTSDGRSTSVGTMAISRFCRPVAWQDFPDSTLPPELQDANPLGILRKG